MVPSSMTVTPLRCNLLADAPAEGGTALAVEVALEAVADRLMQQDARPAGTEDDGHLAGRRRVGVQVGERLMDRLLRVALQHLIVEIGEIEASATTRGTLFALAVFLDDDGNRAADQRPDVGGQPAIRTGHQDHLVFAGQRGHDLDHARIKGARETFETFEQFDLGRGRQRRDGIMRDVQRPGCGQRRKSGQNAILPGGGNRPHGIGGIAERARTDVVGIGEGGLLAGQGAHADALVDVEAAGLDDTLVETPCLGTGILEIQVGIVDLMRQDLAEGARQVALAQREG